MVKLLLTGVWVAIVTLASVYLTVELSKPVDPAKEEAKKKASQEFVRGEVTSFPVIANGHVEGYFLTRVSYIANKEKLAEITVPLPEMLTDQLFTELVGDKVIRIGDNRNFDLKAFRTRVMETINKRLGSDVMMDVMVEQIDYLSKDDLRSNMSQKAATIKEGEKIVREELPADLAAPASEKSGH